MHVLYFFSLSPRLSFCIIYSINMHHILFIQFLCMIILYEVDWEKSFYSNFLDIYETCISNTLDLRENFMILLKLHKIKIPQILLQFHQLLILELSI